MRCISAGGRTFALFGLAGALAGCGDGKQAQAPAAPPPAVTVVKAVEEDIRPQYRFTGRVEAIYKVDLRARVDGFLEKRLFIEGADVKEGELLFTIEKGQYQAAVDEAKAGIVTAEAALKLADIEFSRQSELVLKNVGAQARLDEATAKQGEARGTLLQQKATLERAQLNLSYTDIRAPIAGRIGRANFAVGNFVGPSSGSLATIVSQDPIYVGFPVTQREILAYRAEQSSPGAPAEVVVYLQLADGSRYKHAGKINFLDVTVSQGTDTVLVRASFPNPERTLVDGQLVAVVLESGKPQIVVVVPGQSLQLDQTGAFVLVVDNENKVQVRRVELGGPRGTNMVLRKGLNVGERVVTEGIQRIRPGLVVNATEAKPGA
ncbi:MAG: efflux RND transporter periplasmic adaptor subunit [Tardiphaga sp.]|jgi:membrane fusion protein (multidrug efflux system)|nr:efflux RND transporter periplasmic adaptor subunit [Xanthobacteraceae bacterium]